MCDSSVHSKMWTKMWLKAVYATAFLAFEVALVKMSLAASIHDCWNPEKLNRMKFPVSQRETFFFAFFYSLYYDIHVLWTNYLITIYYYYQHSSLVEIGTIKINCLLFLDSVVLTWSWFFFMYNQCSFDWSFEMTKTPFIDIFSFSPDHASKWSRYYLLKFVTCPWCFSSKQISFEKMWQTILKSAHLKTIQNY